MYSTRPGDGERNGNRTTSQEPGSRHPERSPIQSGILSVGLGTQLRRRDYQGKREHRERRRDSVSVIPDRVPTDTAAKRIDIRTHSVQPSHDGDKRTGGDQDPERRQ